MYRPNKYIIPTILLTSTTSILTNAEALDPLQVDVYANRYANLGYSSPTSQIITKQQIQNSGAQTLLQVLKTSAFIGTLSTSSGNDRDAAITMDGFGENAGQNILVLLDGQPLNAPTLEAIDFGLIPLETVEQIEIIPGSSAVLFGRSAVAGVIQIKTKRAIFTETTLAASLGSFNQRDLHISMGKRLGDESGIRFTASRETGDNYRQNSASAIAQGKLEFKTSLGNSDISYAYTRTLTDQELPGYVPINSAPTAAGTPNDDSDDRLYKHELSLSHEINASSGIFLGANFRQSQQKAFYDGMPSFTQLQSTTTRELTTEYYRELSLGRFSTGIQSSSARFNDNYKPGTQTVNSIFANQAIDFSDQTTLTAGYRLFDVDESKDSGESSKSMRGTGAINLNHKITEQTTAFVKTEQSVRFATIDENAATAGVDFLKPQTGVTYETGLSFKSYRSRFDVSFFESKLKNEIFYDALNWVNKNLPDSKRNGLRVAGNVEPNERLRLGGSALLVEARRTSGDYNGLDVPYVPAKRLSFFVDYRFNEEMSIYAESQFTGEQYTLNDHRNTSEKVASYTVTNVSANWQRDQLKLSLRVSNLFDERYSAYAVTPSATYPGSGQAVSLTLRYTF